MFNSGSNAAGVLPSRVVYWNLVKQEEVVIKGKKAGPFLETGYVYAPYIPLVTTAGNASTNRYGYVIERPGEGINRYIYDPTRDGDINALQDIEEKGLIILDDNEEEHYIDAIDPKEMVDNINRGPQELKATWSAEADQDLQAMYGVKLSKQLVKALSKEIKKEFYGKVTIHGTPS